MNVQDLFEFDYSKRRVTYAKRGDKIEKRVEKEPAMTLNTRSKIVPTKDKNG